MVYWDETAHHNFSAYQGKVLLIYSKENVLLSKAEMMRFQYQSDVDRTLLKERSLVEIDGGHDSQADNYDGLLKHLGTFLS